MTTYNVKKRSSSARPASYAAWQSAKSKEAEERLKTEVGALADERDLFGSEIFKGEFSEANDDILDVNMQEFLSIYERDTGQRLRLNSKIVKYNIINTKILPYFRSRKLKEIRAIDILSWQNWLLAGTNEKGEPYSPTYLRTMNCQLSAIFNHAVKFYGLESNPVKSVGAFGKKAAREQKIWTQAEFSKFINSIDHMSQEFVAFNLLYFTGMRVGELLALTKADIDFRLHSIRIGKSYQRIKGRDIITAPKTDKSNRTIYIPKSLTSVIEEYISKVEARASGGAGGGESGGRDGDTGAGEGRGRANSGNVSGGRDEGASAARGETRPGSDTGRLFTISKNMLRSRLNAGAEKSGVKRIRIHDLRHSHVSLLIERGFSPVDIASRLGHESINITMHYAHMFPSRQQDMAAALEEYAGSI